MIRISNNLSLSLGRLDKIFIQTMHVCNLHRVLACVGVIWLQLTCVAVSETSSSDNPETIKGVATVKSWPMYRGNPSLSGVSPAKLHGRLSEAWVFEAKYGIKSSAAIVNNRVFIGSDDGHLYALRLQDGSLIWKFETEGNIESSPLVLGEFLYVGSGDGFVYKLSAKDGSLAWKYETEDQVLGAPNWILSPDKSETWILAGSYDFRLHCIRSSDGSKVWDYETGNYINGSPAVSKGKTVFGGCDALLHVIDLADGSKLKEIEAGAYIPGSAAMMGSMAYVGHYDNEFLCFDLDKGVIAWTYRDRNFPYYGSPAVVEDKVIVGGRDRQLHCLNRHTGEKIWKFPTRGKVDSSPVVVGEEVVFGSQDGRLYRLGISDGMEIQSIDLGQPLTSSPAVIENWVVIGSEDGHVYGFHTTPESRKTARTP
jgi:eukaryotic-like serine/threonine-protein kinase